MAMSRAIARPRGKRRYGGSRATARPRWLVLAGKLGWLGRWVVLAVGAFAWQGWAQWRHSVFFPPPSAILANMYHSWFSGPASHLSLTSAAIGNILPSLGRIGIAVGIAVVVGGPLGIAIGRSSAVSEFLEPLLHFARSIPPVALVTVFIVLFKLGDEMEIAFITFGIIWPILLNTIDGAQTLDPLQVETARVFGLSTSQRVTRLIVPAALPKFFAGLRISVSLALILMVIAELTGSTDGIGYLMNNATNDYDMLALWSGIVLLGILGYALNAVVLGIEHHALAWHRGARRLTSN
jgi:ABC-type nitrate/sulfonate/bicarbonate transport system permease component